MGNITQIPTRPGMGRSLVDHDPRNKAWPTRGVLHSADAPLVEKVWRRGRAYDQGRTSSCVGQTGKGLLNTLPFSTAVPWRTRHLYVAMDFYFGAQDNDEWAGREPDYEGTSARGLIRYLLSIGLIKEARWCFGTQDILQTVSNYGPVGMGTWWSEVMFEPDERGLIVPDGQWIGGHEWEIIGIHPQIEEVEAMSSWGTEWGDRGRFRLKFDKLDELVQADGDAFTIVSN